MVEFPIMRPRNLLAALAALLILYFSVCAALYWSMTRPPDQFGQIMKKMPVAMMMVMPFETLWMRARGGRLAPGDMAPDFRLPTVNHAEVVQLSSFRGSKPVVLIFGSYT